MFDCLKPLTIIADPQKPFLLQQGVSCRVAVNQRGQLVVIAEPPARHFCRQCAGADVPDVRLPR